MTHAVGLAFVAAGCGVIVLAAVGALIMPGDLFNRLHFITPVTSVGAPLAAIGLSVENGQGFTVAEVLFIALLLFVSGPVLESAVARVAAQNRHVVSEEQPE